MPRWKKREKGFWKSVPLEQDERFEREEHQLEVLDRRLSFTRYKALTYYTKLYRKPTKEQRAVREHPLGIGFLTIRQLQYILHEIQRNYLTDIHRFYLSGEEIIVRVLHDTDETEVVPKNPT